MQVIIMVGIYKIENLINGKVYIGQSVNIEERWQSHKAIVINKANSYKTTLQYPLYLALDKYGLENFKFEIIEECGLNELDEREQYWISYFHSWIDDPQSNGYNITLGGKGVQKTTEEQINYIVDLWESKKSTKEICELTNLDKHTVLKYLKSFSKTYTVQESKRRGVIINGIAHTTPVNKYDYTGKLISTYPNRETAEIENNIPPFGLVATLNNKYSSYKNYYYIYADVDQKAELIKHMKKRFNKKPVLQYDINNNFIARYQSAVDAAKSLNKSNSSNITACCSGRTKTAYGYKWQYENPLKYLEEN